MHEKYNVGAFANNDIAVIYFNDTLKFNNATQPIPLPEQNQIVEDKTKCVVSGFGRTEDGTLAECLVSADITIINKTICEKSYGSVGSKPKITEGMICAADIVSK